MRKPRLAALLASGNAAASPVLRALAAAHAIGPVASTSFRVASRIVNAMRAGRAVPSVDAFESCRLVLIFAPADSAAAAVARLAASPLEWRNRSAILIGDDAGPLDPLRERGAVAGVIAAVPGFEDRYFLLEGPPSVTRELRPLLRKAVDLVLIPPGARARFEAAMTLAGHALFPTLVASDAAFASSGIPRHLSDSVLEKAVQRTLRAWLKARRNGWSTLDGPDACRIARQVAAMEWAHPRTGAYLHNLIISLDEFMR
ncbi:MAG TPA: hypothetical protein VMJ34_03175 [Bryobacteraceae bacterium]|nr:hypothetical protein [Bryobacteraceae bacterium]